MYLNTPGRFRRKTWMKCSVSLPREPNEPLEIDFPLYDESFPDADAEEPDYDEDEDDTEELPLLGRSLAQGLVLNRWAKPTATWYTIHLQQTSKGRKRDVSSWA